MAIAYKSPYLQMLEQDSNEADKNEARTLSSIELIRNTPLTLDKLIKENEDRRNRLTQQGFENDVTTQTQSRLSSQEERAKTEAKRMADRDVREYETRRGGDLLENAVRGVLGSMDNKSGQPMQMPANVAPAAKLNIPNVFAGEATKKVFSPTENPAPLPLGKADARVNERTSGPMATAPEAPQQAGQQAPQVSGVVSLLTKDPIIKEAFEKLKGDLAKYPEFAQRYRDEDILGEVVRQLQEEERYSDKSQLARDRQDTSDKLAQARINRLSRPPVLAAKSPKEWPVGLTQKQQVELTDNLQTIERMNDVAKKLLNGSIEPGLKSGLENWIRTKLNIRDPSDAQGYAQLRLEVNDVIKRLAGATVTDQEMNRIMAAMPSTFDDKDALAEFIDIVRTEAANNYNRRLEYADIGKRSPVPISDRTPKIDKYGQPIVPATAASDADNPMYQGLSADEIKAAKIMGM